MFIKELPEKDFERAKKLYCESFHKEYISTDIELLGTILGLYFGEKLIGIAQIDCWNNVFDNKKIAMINNFCIQEDYRNQGYGDFLLKGCIQYLAEKGIDFINMTSNKNRVYAHMLYEKNNFSRVDTILLKKDI